MMLYGYFSMAHNMEIVLGQVGNKLLKLVENKPGEFTFSGFIKIAGLIVGESDIENEYRFIQMDQTGTLYTGQQITDKLIIKSIIFDDGRYKILTENIEDNGRINNQESQDRVSNGEEARDNQDILQE